MIGSGLEEDKSFFGEDIYSGDSESYSGTATAVSGKLQPRQVIRSVYGFIERG
jgi:hypothetical protein